MLINAVIILDNALIIVMIIIPPIIIGTPNVIIANTISNSITNPPDVCFITLKYYIIQIGRNDIIMSNEIIKPNIYSVINGTESSPNTYTDIGYIDDRGDPSIPTINWKVVDPGNATAMTVAEYIHSLNNTDPEKMIQCHVTAPVSSPANIASMLKEHWSDLCGGTWEIIFQANSNREGPDQYSQAILQFYKTVYTPLISINLNGSIYSVSYTLSTPIQACPSVSWIVNDDIMHSESMTIEEYLISSDGTGTRINSIYPSSGGSIGSNLSKYWGSLADGKYELRLQANNNKYTIYDYKTFNFTFTKYTNSAPTITPSKTDLREISAWPGLTYTVKDVNNDLVTFTEKCGSKSHTIPISATAAGVNQSSYVNNYFNELSYGSHTITATVIDGNKASNSCTVSFTKVLPPNSAPTVSPSSKAHGSSNTYKTLDGWTVNDAEGGVITYTEVLNDTTTLQSGTVTLSAGGSQVIASMFDQNRWNTCSFGAHTVKFTATDSRGASVIGTQTFTKTNYLPEITAITPESLGTVHTDPKIQYRVTDKDSAYTITEYIDNNATGTTYPNISPNTTTTKTAVLNYSNLTFDTHKFKVVVQDLTTNLTVEKTWTFTRGYNAPIISGNDGAYGTYSGAPTITYEVYDPDNLRYSIIEYIDGNIFYSKDGCTGTYKGSMNLASPWPSLSNGNHTIKIVATNTGNISATRTWTVVKDNKAPTISGNNVNLGNINSVLTYDYTVFDPEGDAFTVTEKVDGTILKTYTNCTGNKSFTLDLNTLTTSNKRRWDELSYNAVHTVDIVASDNQGQSATRTISFTKVNMPPTAPEFVTLTTGMRRGNRENNFTFDVEIKPNVDPDGDTQYLSVEAATNFSFTENVRVFEPTSYHKKAPDGSTWIECVSASNTDVVAGYIYKIPVSGLTENTEWYLRLVTTDKTGSGEVVKSTPIQISIGDTLEIETYPKDCLNNRPLYIRVEMNANIDPLADITVYTCNNAYDTSPTWEDCTAEYKNSTAYTYKNSTKTAATWAIAVRVKVVANNATGPIGISNLCISAKRQITT